MQESSTVSQRKSKKGEYFLIGGVREEYLGTLINSIPGNPLEISVLNVGDGRCVLETANTDPEMLESYSLYEENFDRDDVTRTAVQVVLHGSYSHMRFIRISPSDKPAIYRFYRI